MLVTKPPMGWNSWNTFGIDISEKLIMEMADVMVEKGYKAAGYEYVVIDDCWSKKERNADGLLEADPEKFPHGMKYLSDYVHSKGLKFGIYSCAGVKTCAGYPSSYHHEFDDARTFAEWGVDFLKYDFCNFPRSADCKNAYETMSLALKASGRDILFSACNWGREEPWKWMRSAGVHMYRSTGDIYDNFESIKNIFESQKNNFCMSGSGCFNDIDMLVAGLSGKGNVGASKVNDGLTSNGYTEYKTHFALWCIMGAPLMMGADLRGIAPEYEALMQNRELIALNQDAENRQPYEIAFRDGGAEGKYACIKHLDNKEYAIAYFNFEERTVEATISFDEAGLPYYSGLGFDLTDIFTGERIGTKRDFLTVTVPAHDCVIYRAKVVKAK